MTNATEVKTAAAAHRRAPVVADKFVAGINDWAPRAQNDGYGACPLMVERGRVVWVGFGFDDACLPSFLDVLVDGTNLIAPPQGEDAAVNLPDGPASLSRVDDQAFACEGDPPMISRRRNQEIPWAVAIWPCLSIPPKVK